MFLFKILASEPLSGAAPIDYQSASAPILRALINNLGARVSEITHELRQLQTPLALVAMVVEDFQTWAEVNHLDAKDIGNFIRFLTAKTQKILGESEESYEKRKEDDYLFKLAEWLQQMRVNLEEVKAHQTALVTLFDIREISLEDNLSRLWIDRDYFGRLLEDKFSATPTPNGWSVIHNPYEDKHKSPHHYDVDFSSSPSRGVEVFATPYIADVFFGILQNAFSYSPPRADVAIRIIGEGRQAKINITNYGVTIPPAQRERVFQRFESLDHPGIKGTGLGLAVARDRISQMRGSIKIYGSQIPSDRDFTTVSVRLMHLQDGDPQ